MSQAIASSAIVYVGNPEQSKRRKARTLDFRRLANRARTDALSSGGWVIRAHHGGSVANAYGYPAYSDTALIASDPDGNTVVWIGTTSALKITYRSAARSALPCSADAFDLRTGASRTAAARDKIKAAHAARLGA